MKYILKEKIPFTNYQIGHVFETDFQGDICYEAENDGIVPYNTIQPHEILLLVKAGILEEYDDTFPKKGDRYWFIDSTGSICSMINDCIGRQHQYRIKANNCFRTEEAALARLKEIMGE